MLKNGRCVYCGREKQVAPIANWDDPTKVRYYCQDHYYEVNMFEEKQKKAFLDYYSNETTRSWLSPKNLELYKRLTEK